MIRLWKKPGDKKSRCVELANGQWAIQEFKDQITHCSVVKKKPERFKESELVHPGQADAEGGDDDDEEEEEALAPPEEEEEEDEEEDEDEMPPLWEMKEQMIRGKWTMDGANTLSEAAEKLRSFADDLDKLADEGWQLRGGIYDDWGFAIIDFKYETDARTRSTKKRKT